MAATDVGLEKCDKEPQKEHSHHVASAYLWKGFCENINITTFDLFTKISIKDIAFGDSHSLFLTEHGEVFVTGLNDMGQLGVGSLDIKVTEEPIKLQGISDPVTRVSCGKHHSAVITDTGQVFCWGSSRDGQCGTGSLDLVLSPALVAVEINTGFCQHGVPKPSVAVFITDVSCGSSHTLAVSSAGEVWAWGFGPQLGLGELRHAPVPRRVDTLQGHMVTAVSCGERHSMVLVLRGDRGTSRSSSPLKSKGKTEAKSVLENSLYPSRCSLCNKEIYTYTDTNDMCIIDALHECTVSDSVRSIDSTIVEDISSSSSSEALRRSATGSPEERGSSLPPEGLKVEDSLPDNRDKLTDGKGDENAGHDGLLNHSSILELSACDTSVLVITSESPFGEENLDRDADRQDDVDSSASPEKNRQADTELELGRLPSAKTGIDATGSSETLQMKSAGDTTESKLESSSGETLPDKSFLDLNLQRAVEGEGGLMSDRSQSVESDGEVWMRRSMSEDLEEDLRVLSQRNRNKSLSTTSVRSLDLSGAREYLQRQFEDEKGAETVLSPSGSHEDSGSKPSVATETAQDDKAPSSFGDVFGYSSSMLAQVKSATSRAITNIQAFSMFSSSSDNLAEGESTQNNHPQIELSSLQVKDGDAESRSKEKDTSKNNTDAIGSTSGNQSGGTRSGTFIEWSREMASVDDDPTSLTKNSDQRSLRTIEMQQKNLSRTSQSSTSGPAPMETRVVTATDVWVWGCNELGQLGLGDQLDRAQPIVVKMFVGRHVIKLAAGDNHSLALTANSQVYSWGSNSYGQLGHPETVHVPTRMKFMKGFMAWDVAAGSVHSIFLGDSPDAHPDVLYCGKHPSTEGHTSLKKTNTPVSIAEVKQFGWITGVMAGSIRCACRIWSSAPPETEPVFELAATERAFYNQLIKTSNLLLRPLQRSSFYTSMDVYPFKSSLQSLVGTFGALTKKIGEGITDLTSCIQDSTPLNYTLMLGSHSEFMEAFRNYSRSFSDFLAVGGFDYCTRTGSEFFEKIQGSITDLSEERDKSVAASSLFMRAMRYPFFRLVEYSRIITKIAASVTNSEIRNQLQSVVLDWDGLKISFSSEHKLADSTRLFWETAFPKLADNMRSPDRRVLRESKTHPLQMPSGGRFTSRLFVLFNNAFLMQSTVITSYPLETLWVESGTSDGEQANVITIITPEEKFDVLATTPAEKAEWLIALNSAISKVLTNNKSLPSLHSSGERFTPPLIRHASHTFVKIGPFKDATYSGTWLLGKIHGAGTLKWQDDSMFEGNFKRGLMHGSGTFTIVKSKGREVQKGNWRDGKLNGLATINYANGDLYEGHFQDGKKFGHGMYQSGRHKSSYASIYIGEWLGDLKEGYGVQDDIHKGEKYMGMWVEDYRHGSGVLVTLDGMYFEGNFVQNKLMGFGVMISDDNTLYEGDFMDITHLSGKGTLTLSTGDKLEGAFSGTLNEGLKVNGTFIKSATSPDFDHRIHPAGVKSKYFGQLGVHADSKWSDIFSHTSSVLGQACAGKSQVREDTYKAWEVVAVMVNAGKQTLKNSIGMSPSKLKAQQSTLEGLEKIPSHCISSLSIEAVAEMSAYLAKACDTIYHPLGQLMETLVDVFRASYIGIGAHPRLLHHAVLEMKSYIRRLYKVVRILFPALPANGGPVHVYPQSKAGEMSETAEEAREFIEGLETEDPNLFVFTAAGLLYPILLPKIYPPLFDLYALYNEKNDDQYWERVTKLNRQSDMGLMAYLGIEQRFWLMEDVLQQDKTQKLSTIKDVCYAEAVDTLQQLSTAFSPIEKLKIIEQTFNEITKTVTLALKDDHMWCMDDLFPIFQFVVVRAKIHHLGAEIHMVDDLIEPHLEHGELGLMFTTLKACYFQIQNEKMPHH